MDLFCLSARIAFLVAKIPVKEIFKVYTKVKRTRWGPCLCQMGSEINRGCACSKYRRMFSHLHSRICLHMFQTYLPLLHCYRVSEVKRVIFKVNKSVKCQEGRLHGKALVHNSTVIILLFMLL